MNSKFIFTFFALIIYTGTVTAQQQKAFIGTWSGKINVGVELRIVLHIKEDSNIYTTTMDSPDQSVFGIATDETTVNGNEVSIRIEKAQVSISGKMLTDSTIEAIFKQGQEFPLLLRKSEQIVAAKEKPQTPKAPFPYKAENITYQNKDKTIQFGATITIPEGKGPFPAVVLISGSGPQNRDGKLLGNIYWVLADHLTRNGFIVLRYDERGIAESTGDFATATTKDFANDAATAVDYLLSKPEVNKKKIGFIGHSEGGIVAPIVATERNDINFIVTLAGPGTALLELMAEQNEAIAKNAGMSESSAKEFYNVYKLVVSSILLYPDTETAIQKTTAAIENWAADKESAMLQELNLNTTELRTGYATQMAKQFQSKWLRSFVGLDPATYLEQLNCKLLALNGGKDIQVLPASNLAGIKAALGKSKSPFYETKEIPGLNHLFQTCKKCSVSEYAELEETISPTALQTISDWLNKNVK